MKLFLDCLVILLLYPVLNDGFNINQDPFERDICNLQEELAKLFKLNKFKLMNTDKLKKILDQFNVTSPEDRSFIADKTLCGTCMLLVNQIQQKKVTVTYLARAVCKIYIALATLTVSDFCEDVIRIHLPTLEYILNNSKILDAELACSIILQNQQCYYSKPALKWRLKVPSKSLKKIPRVNRNEDRKQLKILHLTDFHITPDYEVGGVENCGYPLCCKRDVGNPVFGANAGLWGDYNCDVPPWLFGRTMLHINQTHKDIDLVYFTGDIIDHTIWKASINDNSNLIYITFKTLFETFPNKPVLSAIGNHETAPLNVFPPSEDGIEKAGLSAQWLYTLLSKLWSSWLSKESLKTVEKQGYYSYVVNKKFRIIALNNNICCNLNWWLLYNTTYLNEQLHFLSTELEKAEKNEQFVHIITHIPVGNKECIEPWEVSYNNLIKRFSHIIKGQFYGHTHTDELKIFYDEKHIPINVGYNGASLTPYQKYNPNYKIITVDPYSYDVLDVDTYYFNLTEANKHPNRTPRWLKLYSMKNAYGLNNLSPKDINKAATSVSTNNASFNQYWRFYVRDGDASLKDGCDEKCKNEVICKIFTTVSLNSEKAGCT
ncbi:sphingomyelin phosphodiesterase 1-like [Anoplophora glabripennis]|uniref:sphingomyelin phosphodiesterase 1-like n=1 Tax=Anoplophora glabripennis TaxID=217634 RepID=UPI000875741C|nr:sphingomyelin phosphodiesterase 1-like [Anoplophora glabripennis]